MSFTTDIADDYLIVDGIQDVTFRQVKTAEAATVEGVSSSSWTKQEKAAIPVGVNQKTKAFSGPVSEFPAEPVERDTITVGGVTWTIIPGGVSKLTMETRYRILCVQER